MDFDLAGGFKHDWIFFHRWLKPPTSDDFNGFQKDRALGKMGHIEYYHGRVRKWGMTPTWQFHGYYDDDYWGYYFLQCVKSFDPQLLGSQIGSVY